MELSRDHESDMFIRDYPPLVERDSGPLPSNKVMPKGHRRISTSSPKPELIIRENASWLDPGTVMQPFRLKHLRTRSLPEATMLAPQSTDEHCSPAQPPGSTLPYKKYITKKSSNAETALLNSGVAVKDVPPLEDPFLVAKNMKKRGRSMSNGDADVSQLVPKATTEEYELPVNPHIPPLNSKKHRGSLRNSEADKPLLLSKIDAEQSSPCVPSQSQLLSSGHDTPSPCLDATTTTLDRQVTSDGHVVYAFKSQPRRRSRVSSNASNFALLPPQEWTLDSYQPIISPASIPLPTSTRYRSTSGEVRTVPTIPIITVTAPNDKAKEPSESTSKVKHPDEMEILDSSRLHPNAAWSQLANRAHRKNLNLLDENDMLRLQNEALKNLLVKFSRVLGDMEMDKQVEFQKTLNEMPAAPPKSRAGNPRGT